MGYLNGEKPPDKITGPYIKAFVERLRTALNYLDDSNFPDGINGTLLRGRSVPIGALSGFTIYVPIIGLAVAHTVTATTLTNVGGYVLWDSNVWGSGVNVQLEICGGSTNASATATFELHGLSGLLATVTSNTGAIELKRSTAFPAPTTSQTLLVKMMTSNATYASSLLTARLVVTIK